MKAVVLKHLLFKDDRIVDVVLAAILANLFGGDPAWLMLVAPPSTGKTEFLRALDGLPFIYFLSTLTAQTFISGKKNKDGTSCSLLWKLNDKILIVKDFTSILSMKFENRAEVLGQLREIADGRLTKGFGTGDTQDWRGRVGFIGAVTPVYDTFHGVISVMGDRFLLWRSDNSEDFTPGLTAIERVGNEGAMREEMLAAVTRFMKQLKGAQPAQVDVSQEVKEKIVNMALFAARLRCPVEREHQTKLITYDPCPEGSPRLSKQLFQMGVALAVINGHDTIGPDEFGILAKMTFDLTTSRRAKIVRHLYASMCWESTSTWATTSEVALALEAPTNTVKYALEDLMVLNIVRRDLKGADENAGYRWQLSNRTTDMIGFSDLLPEPKPVVYAELVSTQTPPERGIKKTLEGLMQWVGVPVLTLNDFGSPVWWLPLEAERGPGRSAPYGRGRTPYSQELSRENAVWKISRTTR